jgi:hypothetical protein
MSALVCAMSGDPPLKPVVSRKSGHIFEKSIISKYILETGTCPVTGQELSAADLIELKANPAVKPQPVSATSLPGLIGAFQTEWDASMIETHELRKELEQVPRPKTLRSRLKGVGQAVVVPQCICQRRRPVWIPWRFLLDSLHRTSFSRDVLTLSVMGCVAGAE